MKKSFFPLLLVFFVLSSVQAFADFPISQGLFWEYETAPRAAYNLQNDEFLVVWNAFNLLYSPSDLNFFGPVRGQRIKASGELIGTPFDIIYAGVLADVAYNANQDEYLVVAEQWYNTVGQRLDASGNKIGGQVTLISSARYPRVIYNSLLHNYLVTGVGNVPGGSCDIYTIQVDAYGSPIGSATNVTTGLGGSCNDPIYSIAYAPLETPDSLHGQTLTPGGRYLLAGGPKSLMWLDSHGKVIPVVYAWGVWYNEIPFMPEDGANPLESYNIDVAYGGNSFALAWSETGGHKFCGFPWKGVMGSFLDADRTYFLNNETENSGVFPISWIADHWVDQGYNPEEGYAYKDWRAKVAYNAAAKKFVVAWRETPSTDPANDTTVNHIRVDILHGICPQKNIVVSSTTGTEDPKLPFITSSTTSLKVLVGWEDHRDLVGRIFGAFLDIPKPVITVQPVGVTNLRLEN